MKSVNNVPPTKPILGFIQKYVRSSGSSGAVVAISGGVDSAVVASLAVRALGSDKVLGLLLFEEGARGSRDYSDARQLVSTLGIESLEIGITPIVEGFKVAFGRSQHLSKKTLGNVKARVRMILLYAVANERNLLVVGTGDKSEELVGYFTKYGDGGVDLQPIAHLYKTQVLDLGRRLSVPEAITSKAPSPNLWEGQKAADELPLDYPALDPVLRLLYEEKVKPSEVSKKLGVPTNLVRRVVEMHDKSAHKRRLPPSMDDDGEP